MASDEPKSNFLDAQTAKDLIDQLRSDRDLFLNRYNGLVELLAKNIADQSNLGAVAKFDPTFAGTGGPSSSDSRSHMKSSLITGEVDSDEEDVGSLFASKPLEPDEYTLDGLIQHIQEYDWPESSKRVIDHLHVKPQILNREPLFPQELGTSDDRSHHTHYSIFNVMDDGTPMEIRSADGSDRESRSMGIWNRIKAVNADPNPQKKKAVGRITIVREPSPLLFAALHYTHHKFFDIDEQFEALESTNPKLGNPHRAFDKDPRKQRGFLWNMEFFTIIEPGCEPMKWQQAEVGEERAVAHVPLARCSSTVALALEGEPIVRIRNKDRHPGKEEWGNIFDPFSPWRVISICAHPDLESDVRYHDSTKHYINGPEAFLVTLRHELKDAVKRLRKVQQAIAHLIEPSHDFLFNEEARETLLFEDRHFTYSKRYFWATQTLSKMNEDIHDIVENYHQSFTSRVWDGSHKIIWPQNVEDARQKQWRSRLKIHRLKLEDTIKGFHLVKDANDETMRAIKTLRENLFSGTSVRESRLSIDQNHNIKLLTLVTIFFLPLTFVTSVFSMTNMPANRNFLSFGWTTVLVCIPTYVIIGCLINESGLAFWSKQWEYVRNRLGQGSSRALKAVGILKSDQRFRERKREKPMNNLATSKADRNYSPTRRLQPRETFHFNRRWTASTDPSAGLSERRTTATGSMSRSRNDTKGSIADSLRLTRSPTLMSTIDSNDSRNNGDGIQEKLAETSSEISLNHEGGTQSPTFLQRIFTKTRTRSDGKDVV